MSIRKRPANKTPLKIEEEAQNAEDEEEELSANSKGGREGTRGRQDNSLSVLTKKFIDLIKSSENATIDLNVAV